MQRTDLTSPSRGAKARADRMDRVALVCLLAVPAGFTLRFLPYYFEPLGERVRDASHALLRPAGAVGLAFGIAGLAMFLFMWLYPLRKRARAMRSTGGLGTWLRVHVLVGLTLPFVVAVHAAWRFTGLIGLGYAAMVLVILSGIVGRYIYARIPRQRSGTELSREEVAGERRALLTRIAAESGLDPAEIERALAVAPLPAGRPGAGNVVARMIADDMARRRALSEIRRRWSEPRPGSPAPDPRALKGALRLARQEIALAQQVRMLDATHRVFGWWHVAHLPVALTAVVAILVHVVVAALVGGVLR